MFFLQWNIRLNPRHCWICWILGKPTVLARPERCLFSPLVGVMFDEGLVNWDIKPSKMMKQYKT